MMFRSILFAALTTSLFSQTQIDKEIDAIGKAPVKKRYELMNRLKEKLIKMRRKERIEAIKKLQKLSGIRVRKKKAAESNNTQKPFLRPEELLQEHIENQSQRYIAPEDIIQERQQHGSF